MRKPLTAWIAAAALAGAAGASAQTADPAAFPAFEAEPCCQLCPAAANPMNYPSGFLGSFRLLVQGEDGWLFRSEDDLRMTFHPDEQGLRLLRAFREALDRRGVTLVMVVQPPRGLVHASRLPQNLPVPYNADVAESRYREALSRIRSTGVIVPDLHELVSDPGEQDFFFRADHHWTPFGARRTAEVVAERVRALPVYASLDKQDFTTRRDGLLAKRGTMSKAARLLCGYGAADQYVPRYVTESGGASGGDALFGEASAPQVALVGTSNSDEAYNFGGFLAEYLETDVLNVASAGGGMEGAMLSYLPSPAFQETPPKVLVWELETYHNLSDPDFYRAAMPLVHNGCSHAPAVLDGASDVGRERREILFNGGGKVEKIRSDRHVLDLQVEGGLPQALLAEVWYTNGRQDSFTLEPDAAIGDGRYVIGLRSEGDWAELNFLSLDLRDASPVAPGQPRAGKRRVHARLCSVDVARGSWDVAEARP